MRPLGFAPAAAHVAAYGAAKAAIGSLTRTLAVEWAPHRIRVNAVVPGDIRTPMYDVLEAQRVVNVDLDLAWHPIGRIGEPSEVAAVVDFLLSDDASFMTGEIVRVDGGFTAKKT